MLFQFPEWMKRNCSLLWLEDSLEFPHVTHSVTCLAVENVVKWEGQVRQKKLYFYKWKGQMSNLLFYIFLPFLINLKNGVSFM